MRIQMQNNRKYNDDDFFSAFIYFSTNHRRDLGFIFKRFIVEPNLKLSWKMNNFVLNI